MSQGYRILKMEKFAPAFDPFNNGSLQKLKYSSMQQLLRADP